MIVRMVVVGVMTVVRMFVVRLLCGCHHIDNRHHHSVVVMMGNNGMCQQTDIGGKYFPILDNEDIKMLTRVSQNEASV